ATVTGAVVAPSGSTRVTVTITDKSGALVNSLQIAPQSSGLTNFTWNGTDSAGSAVPAGLYSIAATSSDGTSNKTLTPLIAAKVQSVTVDSSTQGLDLNTENGSVPLSDVVSVL
ncbi:MAG: FlgD immunoglobulin-like domain containing protein, partial [Steroidobacteraceae bacterium]